MLGMIIKYGPKNDVYGKEALETYSFTELLEDFKSGLGDIYLSFCNLNFITYKQFDISVYVVEESIIFVIPKPKKIEDWRLLATIFNSKLWISIVVGFLISVGVFALIAINTNSGRLKYFAHCFFLIFCTFLNMGYNIYPRTFKLRILYVCLVLFSLNINAYLQGKLYSNMSKPVYEKEITNTVDLLDSGIPLIFNRATSLLFLFNGPVNLRVYRTYIPSENIYVDDDLIGVVKNQDYATVIRGGILDTHPYARPLITKFDITKLRASICVKRYHVLFEKIDEYVTRFVEHGIVNKFITNMKHTYGLDCYKSHNCNFSNKRTVKLSRKNLQAAFFIYAVGIILACLIFLGEMSVGRLKNWYISYNCLKIKC